MERIQEPARDIPVCHTCDLCVIGGSTTGVFAAIAAARLGASVAIVESLGMFGGTATASLVTVWHSRMNTTYERNIIGGLPIELMDRLSQRDALIEHPADSSRQYVFSPAEMAIELDEMIVEAGVRPFLHTRFVAPGLDDAGNLVAAIIEDKTGRRAIRVRYFIDASGDADLAYRLGCETYTRAALQPPTTCAMLLGLGKVREQNPGFDLRRVVFDPQFAEALRPGFLWTAVQPGIHDLHMMAGTRIHGADLSDADQRTQAEMRGRAQVRRVLDILQKHVPGGDQVTLAALPARIGIRETRHVRCQHQLTEQEVLTGNRFDDAIANGSYRVDVHYADGDGLVFRYLDGTEVVSLANGDEIRRRWRAPQDADPTFYQIPYRSLVPQGARNLLVAGRCLDADEGAFGGVRVMINTAQTGQAAGVAAWLALRNGISVADVDASTLRQTLSDQGALII